MGMSWIFTCSRLARFPTCRQHPCLSSVHHSAMTFDSAMIVLHEPHAVLQASGCISATKLLVAARQTLTLIYSIWSTSFDLALLDVFICVRRVFSTCASPLLTVVCPGLTVQLVHVWEDFCEVHPGRL